MEQELTSSLKKVVKGTGIVFAGTILGTLLGFVFRVIVVRYITKSEYGLLSLTLAMLGILSVVSSLGFQDAVPRYVSYAFGEKDYSKIWAIIKMSIKLVAFLSIALSSMLFFFSPHIAVLFHKPNLAPVIKIMAFVLPLMVLTDLLISILRGFEDVKAMVYFQNILSMGLKIIILGLVILLGLSFKGVLYTYLIGGVLVLIFLIYYARNKIHRLLPKISNPYPSVTKELVFFSLLLLSSGIFTILREQSTILLLGYFKPADIVGLYNISLPLAGLIQIPLTAMAFIYLPVASQLYAQGNLKEMKGLYLSITKWTFFLTLPIFLCMLLTPKTIIHLLFGAKYTEASIALQLLALGFFIHTFLGPNGMTLISLGKANIILLCSSISTLAGIAVGLVLIPKYGLIGAAISAAISLITVNFLASFFLYKLSTIHPFNKDYVKPVVATVILSLTIFYLASTLLRSDWQIFTLIFLILFIFPMTILITKSFTKEDILLVRAIRRKIINSRGVVGK